MYVAHVQVTTVSGNTASPIFLESDTEEGLEKQIEDKLKSFFINGTKSVRILKGHLTDETILVKEWINQNPDTKEEKAPAVEV